jgi:hypothetical protein
MNPAEMTVAAPQEAMVVETGLPPGAVDSATTEQPPPTPEQVRAAEAVFSQEQESQAALNVLGLWTRGRGRRAARARTSARIDRPCRSQPRRGGSQ